MTKWIRTYVARLDDVLGTEVVCDDHGRLGWVRSSLANALIDAHTRKSHQISHGGPNDRTIGPIVRED